MIRRNQKSDREMDKGVTDCPHERQSDLDQDGSDGDSEN